MVTPLYDPKLSGAKFKNWIKAGLGVLFTKEGIEPFVYDEIEQFQQKCLSGICDNNGLPAGTTCSFCCTENVVCCPTNRICNARRGKCNFHRNSSTQYLPSGCPKKICHNFKNEIQRAHRFHGPSYKNTETTKWCSNPWEVAKCFMPPDGYKDVATAAETDFNGIISVIINYEAFQSKIHDNLSKKYNIFEQGREVGKAVRHSPQLEMEDTDLQQYFSVLQNLLSDSGYLSANTDAQNAKTKLLQLQNDTLVIGTDDVRKVLDDVGKAVEDEIRTAKHEYKKDAERQKLQLIEITKRYVSHIDSHGKVSMSQLDKAGKSAMNEIENQRKKSAKEVPAEGGKQKKMIVAEGRTVAKKVIEGVKKGTKRKITEEADQKLKRLKTEPTAEINTLLLTEERVKKTKIETQAEVTKTYLETDETLKKIEKSKTESKDDMYNKLKKELKENLITLYRKRHHTLSLSPLIEESDTPLLKFHVMPDIKSVEIQRAHGGRKEVKSELTSLHDVFYKENEPCRNIYLTAEAGFGKTALSKRLVLTWCQAKNCIQNEEKHFKKEAISTMSEFEFVFLLALHDCSEESDIDEMIMKQIISQLSSTSITIGDLETIFSEEKCLVILDGLDKWTHPSPACKQRISDIPHRKARECTILTTTRPWKLSKIRSSQIERKLELVGLSETSAKGVKRIVISLLCGRTDIERTIQDFDLAVSDRGISDLESNPLLLVYLLCLWCDGLELGTSRTELYCQIVELLLKRTDMQQSSVQPQSDIPQWFSQLEHCTKYYTYLVALGQLAFETLFSENKENTLVFSQGMIEKHLTPEYLKLSLDSGIITQRTEKTLTGYISKFSFYTKTVQDFFGALYISRQKESDIKNIVLNKCKSVQSILDMSTVLVFISVMHAEIIFPISDKFISVISKDKITSKYRTTTDDCKPLKDIQDMYISCMKENTSKKELNIRCQDFFFSEDCKEEKYFSNLTRLAVHNKKNMESINIDTDRGPSLREIIDSCALHKTFKINKIYYAGKDEEGQLPVLLDRSSKCVSVISSGGSWSREMWETLQNNSLLQAIYISDDFEMSHDVLNEFLNYIIHRKTMTEIKLVGLSCTEHSRSCTFSLDFCQHSDLKKLVLWAMPEVSQLKVNSQVKHVTLSRINLGEMSLPCEMVAIEHVVLRDVNMSALTFRDLIKIVEKLSHKVTVEIHNCNIEPETEFEDVKTYICISENFRVTTDEHREFVFETKVECSSVWSDTQNDQVPMEVDPICASHDYTEETSAGAICYSQTGKGRADNSKALLGEDLLDVCELDRLCSTIGITSQNVKKECAKICAGIKARSDQIVHVWPAYKMKTETKVVFVVIAQRKITLDLPWRFEIRILNQYAAESKSTTYCKDSNPLPTDVSRSIGYVVDKNSLQLMQSHAYLSVISAASVKSKGYGTSNHRTEAKPCIVLSVLAKHFIPIDEKPFPTVIDGIPVDVRECEFVFCGRFAGDFHDKVKMGCKISSTFLTQQHGTLGGFVEHPEYGLCGITCAHVVLNDHLKFKLKRKGNFKEKDLEEEFRGVCEIFQPSCDFRKRNVIGKLVEATYIEGGEGVAGVDLALFKLQQRQPKEGNFPDCQRTRTTIRYESGNVWGPSGIPADQRKVQKFGSMTGLTYGEILFGNAVVKEIDFHSEMDVDIGTGKYTTTLYKQYHIKSDDKNLQFSALGDSGALVFMKEGPDEENDLRCIGMVVGVLSDNTCAVTPITAILKELHVNQLKPFIPNITWDKIERRLKEMEDRLRNDIKGIVTNAIADAATSVNNQSQ